MSGQLGTLGFAVLLAALLPARFTTVLCYSGAYSNCIGIMLLQIHLHCPLKYCQPHEYRPSFGSLKSNCSASHQIIGYHRRRQAEAEQSCIKRPSRPAQLSIIWAFVLPSRRDGKWEAHFPPEGLCQVSYSLSISDRTAGHYVSSGLIQSFC